MGDNMTLPASYWSVKPEDLLIQLDSSADGLNAAEAAARLARFGPNTLSARKHATALGLLLNQFKSPIILILIFATLISAGLQDWVDAVIILAIVLGSALLSFWQEYGASNAAEKLRDHILKSVRAPHLSHQPKAEGDHGVDVGSAFLPKRRKCDEASGRPEQKTCQDAPEPRVRDQLPDRAPVAEVQDDHR